MRQFGDNIRGARGKWQLLLALCAGILLAMVQAPWSFPPAFFVSLPILFMLFEGAHSYCRAGLIGWFAGLGYFAMTLSWIVEPFLVDVAKHGWMAPFALFFMGAGLALFWALAFRVAWGKGMVAFVVFWTMAELARAYIFTGFPWGLIAYGWVDTPLIQITSLIGVHGLGAVTLLASVLLVRGKGLIGVLIFATLWGAGSYRLSTPTPIRTEPFTVRILQPNVAQEQKWLPEFAEVFYQRQLDLSAKLAQSPPDMVIWPEAAVPFIPDRRADLTQQIANTVDGAVTLLGARRIDEDGNWFNSIALIDQLGNISARYDKHHLVPFGEYIPFSRHLTWTGIDALTGLGFSAGDGPQVIDDGKTPPFLPLICYEAIFPQHARTAIRPDWIIQITNDAWFGHFSGPYQHFAQAQVRAIEQGLPLARSANTGISGMIDPFGRIVASLPLGEMGVVDAVLPGALPKTFYSKTGDWLVLVFLVLLGFFQYFPYKRN